MTAEQGDQADYNLQGRDVPFTGPELRTPDRLLDRDDFVP